MTNVLSKRSVPVYTLKSLLTCTLNPFREFTYYCVTKCFDNLPFKLNLSLTDMHNMSASERETYINKMSSALENIDLNVVEANDSNVFLKVEVLLKSTRIGTMNFVTYKASDEKTETASSHLAMTFEFSQFDGFDFLDMSRDDNILNFVKDDTDKETVDMIFAHLAGLNDFIEFVRVYKAKSLMTKNIDTFTDKFVKPYVTIVQTAFLSDEFMIACACGEQIFKKSYPYDNYLKSVKEFGKMITDKFGDKYAKKEEPADSSTI